ncbi:hypothetical protein, partial [Paracidovorax wautersii]|uniref:hypothetical protein n=1 Tax=Paracidovorax wautersii TaxID=1177982 RepID=UPI001C31A1F6
PEKGVGVNDHLAPGVQLPNGGAQTEPWRDHGLKKAASGLEMTAQVCLCGGIDTADHLAQSRES